MQPLGAGEIEKGLVDGQRLDQRRERQHGAAHVAADFAVFRYVRLDHHGVRAAAQRLEHRHRRVDAVGARDITGGRDHTALAAADDHRFVDQRRIVALFDCGVEGVAIDMRDGELVELAVARKPRRAAGRTARGLLGRIRQAVAAEAHGISRSQCPPSAASALPTSAGSRPVSAANVDSRRSSPAK